jgi:hypothetical protein
MKNNKNWHKIALSKNLSFLIYSQLNNDPIYKVINLVTRVVLYEGKSRYKALKIIDNYKKD